MRVYLQNMLYFKKKKKMICELCVLLRAWSELVLCTKGSFLLVFFWFQAGIVGNAFVIQMTMFPKNISLRSCFNFYMEFKLIQSKYKTRYGKCGWGVWRRGGGGEGVCFCDTLLYLCDMHVFEPLRLRESSVAGRNFVPVACCMNSQLFWFRTS